MRYLNEYKKDLFYKEPVEFNKNSNKDILKYAVGANFGLMSIFWTQKVKLFYAALLANNSH